MFSKEGRKQYLTVVAKESQKGFEVGNQTDDNEIRTSVPLEITVRLGTQTAAAAKLVVGEKAAAEGVPAPAAKALTRGAEALKIDKNYDNRRGYKADFIPGYDLPPPTPSASLAKQVAPCAPERTTPTRAS
jgi:endonuclease G, mitochondrial